METLFSFYRAMPCRARSCHGKSSVDSAPSLGVYYFLSLTLSVRMSVCMSVTLLQIDSSSLFLDGIEPFLAHHFCVWHSTKLCSSIFDLGPLTPKIYSPKFWHNFCKRNNSARTADRTEMFAPTTGFSGMADSMEP